MVTVPDGQEASEMESAESSERSEISPTETKNRTTSIASEIDARITNEISRQRRVADQHITMSAILRDRYMRRSTALTLGILAGSVVAAGFAFASGESSVTVLGVTAARTTWIGWLSLFVFFLSLVDLTVEWKKKSERYDNATHRLAGLKTVYRGINLAAISDQDLEQLKVQYETVMSDIPAIPDRQFVHLKSVHTRKVAMSKLLDEYPGASQLFLRSVLWRQNRKTRRAAGIL